jgi:hypothetical protein
MFKDTPSYDKGIKRIKQLQELEKQVRLSIDDEYELNHLMLAAQEYEDQLDAECRAEHEFMARFEEQFLASMER